MSLELKISAGNAKATLDDITAAANRLKSALDGLPQATRFNNLVKSLNSFTGIPPSAIGDIDKLGSAINRLASARDLSTIAKGLNSLGRVDMTKVATNVERLSAALRGFVVPTGLIQAAAMLDKFGKSAQAASASTRGLTASLRGLKVPAGLSSSAGQVAKLANSFSMAGSGASAFSGSLGSLNGLLAGFGVTVGAVGFGRFVSGLNDAEKQMASFKSIVNTTMKDAGGSAQSFDMLTDTAKKFGLPLRDLVATYPKFATALRLSGQDANATNTIYKNLSVALAGVGADAIKTQRVFTAVEQMFNKGSVTAEELKQQLGDAIPGAVATFARSMGVGTQELLKMMEAGNVASSNVGKFAALLASEMGPAAEAMAKTWIGASNRMASEWYKLQLAVSEPFFEALIPSVNSLANAVAQFVSSGNAAALGAMLGQIAAGAVSLGAALVNLVNGPFGPLITAVAAAAAAALALGGAWKVLGLAASALSLGSLVPLVTSMGSVAVSAAGIVTSFAMLNPVIAGVGIAVAVLAAAYYGLSGSSETAADAAKKLYTATSAVQGPVDTVGEAMYVAAHAGDAMGVSMTQVAEAQRIFAAEISVLEGLVTLYTEQMNAGTISAEEAGKKMEELTARMVVLQDAIKRTSDGAAKHAQTMDSVSSSVGAAGNSASAASNEFRDMGSGMASATSKAQALDQALSDLASSQREYDTSTTTVETLNSDRSTSMPESRGPIGFEGTMFDSGSLFSGGGISHKGTSNKWRNLPAALWKGAPKLAGGIANTNQILGSNGIPAILHPNEAVVPLTGGGSIPIAGGGGGGSDFMAGAVSQLISVNLGTKTEVTRVKEAVDANTAITKAALDKINMTLMAISTGIMSMKGGYSGSSGGSSSSGGGSSFGVVGDGGTGGALTGGTGVATGALGEFAQQANSLSRALSQANDRTASIWNNSSKFYYGTGKGGVNPGTFVNPGDRAAYEDAQRAADYADSEYMDYLWSNPQLAAAYFREKATTASTFGGASSMRDRFLKYAKIFDTGKRQSLAASSGMAQSGFATGSPNASKDLTGGFRATLHPDEAVIPLPDGRSVPVTMPDKLMNTMLMLERDYRGGGSGSVVERSRSRAGSSVAAGSSNVVHVQMNIQTPDAASFSKSKAQIMQEFKSEFDRIAQRYGAADKREDPTRRNKR